MSFIVAHGESSWQPEIRTDVKGRRREKFPCGEREVGRWTFRRLEKTRRETIVTCLHPQDLDLWEDLRDAGGMPEITKPYILLSCRWTTLSKQQVLYTASFTHSLTAFLMDTPGSGTFTVKMYFEGLVKGDSFPGKAKCQHRRASLKWKTPRTDVQTSLQ